MTLAIGTRVGSFELTGTLGAGGMGEVYRAHDTKLDRDVALKVLPDHLLDTDRLARFIREAQVVASLSHPNIGAIHGLEQLDGRPVLVLELVEGPTLADRIAQDPIPQDEGVSIARQIAEALEAAHEQGVVHRDLKPANIKLRPDGLVKVLDFGLAKLTEPSGVTASSSNATLSPTITSPAMTGIGLILGTAAYMSPEQAAGKPADRRADIWSFGVVLWEMLTGQRLFGDGESTSHVLADVLRAPIDFEQIPAGTLRDLLRRCLDRNVKTRLRDIGEARVALSGPIDSKVVERVERSGSTAPVAWVVAALLALATGVAVWAPWRAEPERPLVRLDVDLGENVALPSTTLGRNVMLSPDGTRLMYIASVGGAPNRLYVRRLEADKERTIELPGTDGATAAAFSPDSRSVAFIAGTRVYRVSADGGAALRLAELQIPSNQVTWGDGDVILASGVRSGLGLARIPAQSGSPIPLTELAGTELIHASPEVLPGGKNVLFIAGGPTDVTTIEAIPVVGGPRKVIVPNGLSPRYIPTGHLLYLLRDTLFAIRFDPDTLQTSGDAVPIVDDVKTTFSGLVAVGGFSVAANGTLVYRRAAGELAAGPQLERSTIEWIEGRAKRTPLVTAEGTYFDPRISPSGTQLLLTVLNPSGPDVAVYDSRRDRAPRRLSFDSVSVDPIWIDKEARYIAYLNLGNGISMQRRPIGGLRWRRIDGGEPQTVLPDVRVVSTGAFSAAVNRLAYVGLGGRGVSSRRNIFTVAITEDSGLKFGTPERFSPEEFNEFDPRFSPDGRWVAFVSDRSGRNEVYVRAVMVSPAGVRYERQVSSDGGESPRWSHTKSELVYQSGDEVIAVPYAVKAETWEPAKSTVRVEKFGGTEWDLAADDRIAVITPVNRRDAAKAQPADHTVVFLQNFFDEVRRRVK